jgi:hypothetical protein
MILSNPTSRAKEKSWTFEYSDWPIVTIFHPEQRWKVELA